MEWTRYGAFMALLLVVTGSLNTLSTKWADKLDSEGSDGKVRPFMHPFMQGLVMFLGELMCLVTYKIGIWYTGGQDAAANNPNFSPLILLPPALFDMISTTTMYIGLSLTYASSFQMLRGAVIVFVAILSMAFMNRKLRSMEWLGIFLIISGLTVVGLSDFTSNQSAGSKGTNAIITGDLLILCAQVITSFQMVYEEKFIKEKNIPCLVAVGYEGLFGALVLGSLMIPFYWIPAYPPFSDNPRNVLEDVLEGCVQLYHNGWLIVSILGTFVSIAFFNYAGIFVTKEISATTRMVLDSVRTLVVWAVSVLVKWQAFSYLQVIGFVLLIVGMFLYNNVVIEPSVRKAIGYMNRRAGARHTTLIEEEGEVNNTATNEEAAVTEETGNISNPW